MRFAPVNEEYSRIQSLPKIHFPNENLAIYEPSKYKLHPMNKTIINHRDLHCKQTKPQSLELEYVNKRTAKCESYLNSLFNVIYPNGINQRKR